MSIWWLWLYCLSLSLLWQRKQSILPVMLFVFYRPMDKSEKFKRIQGLTHWQLARNVRSIKNVRLKLTCNYVESIHCSGSHDKRPLGQNSTHADTVTKMKFSLERRKFFDVLLMIRNLRDRIVSGNCLF